MPTTASRFHGRNARLYVGLASSSAAASPVGFMTHFVINNASDAVEVTAWGDTGKTYLVGLPDASGTYEGYMDIAGGDFFTAARDGNARKWYFYPDLQNNAGVYFFSTGFFDQTNDVTVTDVGKTSGNWRAATDLLRVVP